MVSIHHVQKQIAKLRHLDLKSVTLDELEDSLEKILKHYDAFVRPLNATPIYRARLMSGVDLFRTKQDIWYPLIEWANPMGRFNDTGVSLFYCGSDQHTILEEMRPKIGDQLTFISCSLRNPSQPPRVVECGISEAMESYHRNYKPLPKQQLDRLRAEHRLVKGKANQIIREFLAEESTRRISSDETYKYKLTVAIAKLLLESDAIDGFWYPSSELTSSATNLALKPSSVDRLYQLDQCIVVTVRHIEALPTGALKYGIWHSHTSTRITDNGDIEWYELPSPGENMFPS